MKKIIIPAIMIALTGCMTTHAEDVNTTKGNMEMTNVLENNLLQSFGGNTYTVTHFNGDVYTPIDGNQRPTISFQKQEDGSWRAFGNATCNRYNGLVEFNAQGQFKMDKAMVTRMMCMGGGTEMERQFLEGLAQWNTISGNLDNISIKSDKYSFDFEEATTH